MGCGRKNYQPFQFTERSTGQQVLDQALGELFVGELRFVRRVEWVFVEFKTMLAGEAAQLLEFLAGLECFAKDGGRTALRSAARRLS